MTTLLTIPITLVSRVKSGTDSYGDDVYNDVNTTVQGVFAPGGSSEIVQGGDTVTTQPTVYLPVGSVPASIDAVIVAGVRYEVDGDPQAWPADPFTGWQPALPVVVALRKVTG